MGFCENCGTELADNAQFCSNCGNKVNTFQKSIHKNIYLALILTFIVTGLGSIYAGNVKKGLILLVARVASIVIGVFIGVFLYFSFLIWAYAFYEAYKDVEIANGNPNPNLIKDFKGWKQDRQIITVLIIVIILMLTVSGCSMIFTTYNNYNDYNDYSDDSDTSYHESYSSSGSSGGSSVGSSSSSHYGGVDDSPHTIAKNDPDWYYDHYDYGDYDDIDEDLESQGYD